MDALGYDALPTAYEREPGPIEHPKRSAISTLPYGRP